MDDSQNAAKLFGFTPHPERTDAAVNYLSNETNYQMIDQLATEAVSVIMTTLMQPQYRDLILNAPGDADLKTQVILSGLVGHVLGALRHQGNHESLATAMTIAVSAGIKCFYRAQLFSFADLPVDTTNVQ